MSELASESFSAEASLRSSWRTRLAGGVVQAVVVIGSIALALALVAPLLMIGHISPWETYHQLLVGAAGSTPAIGASLLAASPLILIGLGVAISMRAGFLNIGGQGQLYFGALAGTWFVLTLDSLPGPLLILGASVCAALAGGLWSLLAGLAKVMRGANEVVTTLLLNYVAVGVVDWAIYGPLRNGGDAFPQSDQVPAGAVLPVHDIGGVSVGLGIVIGIVLVTVSTLVLRWTAGGYEVRAMASSVPASEYAGIRVRRTMLSAAFLGGGMAGLAGAFEVLGVQLRLSPDFFSTETAFTGVLVALLGNCRPGGVLIAGLFMGALSNGGFVMQQATSAPSAMVYVVEALVLLLTLTGLQLSARGGFGGLRSVLSRHAGLGRQARRGAGADDGAEAVRREDDSAERDRPVGSTAGRD